MMELKFITGLIICVSVCCSSSSSQEIGSNPEKVVEQRLLSMLGMKRRPTPNSKVKVPQAIIDLYHEQQQQHADTTDLPLPGKFTKSANTIRTYTHQESEIDERFLQNSQRFRLNFELSDFPKNEIVTSSELRLTIVPKENRTDSLDSHSRINVYDIVRPGLKGKSRPILRLIDTKLVHLNTTSEAMTVDVLPTIERWLADEKHNYGVLIDVRSSTGEKVLKSPIRLRRSLEEDDVSWQALQPLLFLYAEDTNLKRNTPIARRKRSAASGGKHRKKSREECHRRPLWVDFEKVGWNDWIVAPPGYEAYFCAGDCPQQYGDHMNATNHAIVQTLVHSVHPHTIPKPCCVPTNLASISMLYLDEHNKAVLKNYPDMVVEGCGCR